MLSPLSSTTAVRRMGLTAPPSLSNTLPAMPAASPPWMARSSRHCPCRRRSSPDPPSQRPNPPQGSGVSAPPAPPTTPPSTSEPLTRCATVASASPTCPRTMRTRHWPCLFPSSAAPCWGRAVEGGPPSFTPTPEPSAPRCDRLVREPRQEHPHPETSLFPRRTARSAAPLLQTTATNLRLSASEDLLDEDLLDVEAPPYLFRVWGFLRSDF